mgnify:CR=1 FL=1
MEPDDQLIMLELAEKAGYENLRDRRASADVLAKEASTWLSLLILALGGSFAYGVRITEPGAASPIIVGAAVASVWLAATCSLTIWKCMMIRPLHPLYNEPANLYQPDLQFTERQMREFELTNIQERIANTTKRNDSVAHWLNVVRWLTICAVPAFAATAVGVACYRG